MTDSEDTAPIVGVLAMQGAFREHVLALKRLGVAAVEVRTAADLSRVSGVVVPGGESTAIRLALQRAELLDALCTAIQSGMPTLATCAGLILLAAPGGSGDAVADPLIDIDVERNGFGRQRMSFEADVRIDEAAADGSNIVRGVFIRAPRIARIGAGVQVIGRLDSGEHGGEAVAVRSGTVLGCTFHPELTDDVWLHRSFVQMLADCPAAGIV